MPESIYVLIDDDVSLGLAWKLAGKKAGITVRHFASLAEFLDAAGEIDPSVPVYLDSEFRGARLDLAEAGELLRGRGFLNLHICSGHPAERFRGVGWAKSVVGKVPPWLGRR